MLNFQQARTNMLDSQIQTAGVISPTILSAFDVIPRELFVPEAAAEIAYSDEEISLGDHRFLLEPIVHAKMLQAIDPQPQHVVLDIGVGTGYSSAILSSLVSTVVALECEQKYLEHAARVWEELDVCNVASFVGDLPSGHAKNAPYDLIIFNGAISEIPLNIVEQLAPGGRMICIVRKAGQVMGEATLVESLGKKQFSSYNLFSAGGVYLPGFEPSPSFTF